LYTRGGLLQISYDSRDVGEVIAAAPGGWHLPGSQTAAGVLRVSVLRS
jgi:hypothetical protein